MKNDYYHLEKIFLLILLSFCTTNLMAQGFTFSLEGGTWNSHGNVTPLGGTMLVGGAEVGGDGEVNATQWFVDQSDGGDYLVLRTDGTGGQASWVWSNFGSDLSAAAELSVTTRNAANNATVAQYIRDAEALFIAGGDQREYMDLWKGTAVEEALNYLINVKKVPIGGTSAGMAIMGGAYYAPASSGILSSEILNDPYHPFTSNSLFYNDFLENPWLTNVITDTHLDRVHGTNDENRYGRAFGLLARTIADQNDQNRYAIACDEAVFVCINDNGIAKVYGDGGNTQYPTKAYFMVGNCATPETITSGQGLVFNNNNAAVKAYVIQGSVNGNGNSFSLVDWTTASGGGWMDLYTTNGYNGFNFINGSGATVGASAPNCGETPPPNVCSIPSPQVIETTASSFTVSWNGTGADAYKVRHRVTGSSSWTTVTVSSTNYTINGLETTTTYDFRVRSVCGSEQSNYSPIQTVTTNAEALEYCDSYATSTRYEFIDEVGIDGNYNFSGDNNGYGDYTNVTFDLTRGSSHSIFIDPNTSSREKFEVWIDYNQDGVFDASTEEVFYRQSRRSFTSNFTVPSTAKLGTTRMRISMQYSDDGYTYPCDVFEYGEVEDYTVVISSGSSGRKAAGSLASDLMENILYPNPTQGNIYYPSHSKEVQITVYNTLGNKLLKVKKNNVDLTALQNGVYFIEIIDGDQKSIQKVVKR